MLTKYLVDYFDDLKEAKTDQKGWDYIHLERDKIEFKCLTRNGFCWAQSGDTGKGRKVDRDVLLDFVMSNNIYYLVASIVNFPSVDIAFVTGREVFNHFPNKTCKTTSVSKALEFLKLPPAG